MEAKQYAARNRQGSDWFSHDSSTTTPVQSSPATTTQHLASDIVSSPVTPSSPQHDDKSSPSDVVPARTKPIKPASDSNQWYKYEGQEQTSTATGTATATGAATGTVSEKAQGAEVHQKRSSASEWFSHEHSGVGEGAPHQRGSSKELGANAARMRGESEQWFSHESAATCSPVHCSKARVSTRPSGTSDMHDVFHHAAGN